MLKEDNLTQAFSPERLTAFKNPSQTAHTWRQFKQEKNHEEKCTKMQKHGTIDAEKNTYLRCENLTKKTENKHVDLMW